MRSVSLRMLFVPILLLVITAGFEVRAADPETWSRAVTAWFAKDYAASESLLTTLIDDGTRDARAYYLRGLARHASGNVAAAESDFARGAELELAAGSGVTVARSLERIQGPGRQLLETHRRAARLKQRQSAGPREAVKAHEQIFQQARSAWLAGEPQKTLDLLKPLMDEQTADPRFFYFRGLALASLDQKDAAAADFRRGVELEASPSVRIDVSLALEKVQGPARQQLEEQRASVLNDLKTADDDRRRRIVARLIEERIKAGDVTAAAIARRANALPASARTAPASAASSPSTPAAGGAAGAAQASTLSFAFLPVETELVAQLRVRDLWNSEFLKPYLDAPGLQQSSQGLKDAIGLTPLDVETVTVGIFGLNELSSGLPIPGAPGAAPPQPGASAVKPNESLVAVVRLRAPFDPQLLTDRAVPYEKSAHDGKDYYRPAQAGDRPCIYLPDSRTLVLADEPVLTGVMSQDAALDQRPEFAFVDGSRHFVLAVLPNDPALFSKGAPPANPEDRSASARLSSALRDNVLGLGLSLNLSSTIDFELLLLCADDTTPGKIQGASEILLEDGREAWDGAKALMPAGVSSLVDGLLRATKFSTRGEVFSASTRITKNTLEKAVADAEAALPLLMMAAASSGKMNFGPLPGVPGTSAAPNAADAKKPVEPPKADRVAQGEQITATARISGQTEFDFATGKEKPRAVELVLDVVGPEAAKASSAGFEQVTAAKDNAGADLVLRPRTVGFQTGGFAAIDRNDFFLKHPEGGVQVVVQFEPPAQAPTSIASAEGTIKLRLVDESKDVLVDAVKTLVGQEISNAELTAAGYQLKLEEQKSKVGDADVTQWTLSWVNAMGDEAALNDLAQGGGAGLQRPVIVDAAGNEVAAFTGHQSARFGTSVSFAWTMTLDADKPIPDDARLKLVINSQVSIVDVPFKVENVVLQANAQ